MLYEVITRCRAVAPIDFNEIANIVSGVDGSYQLNCGYYSDHVYVIHSDDYGRKLTTSKAYGLDDYIHPITPNGYRYKCTTAGTSDTTLPTEPWSTTVNLVITSYSIHYTKLYELNVPSPKAAQVETSISLVHWLTAGPSLYPQKASMKLQA